MMDCHLVSIGQHWETDNPVWTNWDSLAAPDTCWLARVLAKLIMIVTLGKHLCAGLRHACRMQSFQISNRSKSFKTCVCYLECCNLLVLMLAYECNCLVVSLCTEVVLPLLRAHGSETPDHEVSRVQVNSYAGMQLLHGMACSQHKD